MIQLNIFKVIYIIFIKIKQKIEFYIAEKKILENIKKDLKGRIKK